jgi:hypothetical protein
MPCVDSREISFYRIINRTERAVGLHWVPAQGLRSIGHLHQGRWRPGPQQARFSIIHVSSALTCSNLTNPTPTSAASQSPHWLCPQLILFYKEVAPLMNYKWSQQDLQPNQLQFCLLTELLA